MSRGVEGVKSAGELSSFSLDSSVSVSKFTIKFPSAVISTVGEIGCGCCIVTSVSYSVGLHTP